ncbi:MAG TPA: glutathione peroxidase [Vicinamibacterales bacterium]|nr:glutathione peroxidase [Vicinamibacterales bacterium]
MSIYDIEIRTLDGTIVSMEAWRGQVLLIVNVASRCGYTPQYAGLEALYRKYGDQGFCVLGFPCNQFGAQEPGSADEIRQFCSMSYDVTFPLFAKIDVNGEDAHPLYRWLKSQKPGLFGSEAIKWNFTKFLVSRSGEVVGRYSSRDTPKKIERDIERELARESESA